MAKPKCHPHPTPATRQHVLAASGNRCAFPSCDELIFDLQHEALLGTICHIRGRCATAARFSARQSEDDNRAAANLLAMCAKHSKVIDTTPGAAQKFSVEKLRRWKRDHESRVAGTLDRRWVRIPGQIIKGFPDGTSVRLCYWEDSQGRPRVYSRDQLFVVNALFTLNLNLGEIAAIPVNLGQASGPGIEQLIQQPWARFEHVTGSPIGDLLLLMAHAPDITFGEFLRLCIAGGDPSALIEAASARPRPDPLVKEWHKSDVLAEGEEGAQ